MTFLLKIEVALAPSLRFGGGEPIAHHKRETLIGMQLDHEFLTLDDASAVTTVEQLAEELSGEVKAVLLDVVNQLETSVQGAEPETLDPTSQSAGLDSPPTPEESSDYGNG